MPGPSHQDHHSRTTPRQPHQDTTSGPPSLPIKKTKIRNAKNQKALNLRNTLCEKNSDLTFFDVWNLAAILANQPHRHVRPHLDTHTKSSLPSPSPCWNLQLPPNNPRWRSRLKRRLFMKQLKHGKSFKMFEKNSCKFISAQKKRLSCDKLVWLGSQRPSDRSWRPFF